MNLTFDTFSIIITLSFTAIWWLSVVPRLSCPHNERKNQDRLIGRTTQKWQNPTHTTYIKWVYMAVLLNK